MQVRVEFYGIPRQRAGVATITATGGRLGEVLADLEARLPGLHGNCIRRGRLLPGCVANLDGDQFVSRPDQSLPEGATLLILSADAGG